MNTCARTLLIIVDMCTQLLILDFGTILTLLCSETNIIVGTFLVIVVCMGVGRNHSMFNAM